MTDTPELDDTILEKLREQFKDDLRGCRHPVKEQIALIVAAYLKEVETGT